jgi:hypothetical protein
MPVFPNDLLHMLLQPQVVFLQLLSHLLDGDSGHEDLLSGTIIAHGILA